MSDLKNINYAELVEFIGEKFERTNQAIEDVRSDLGGEIKNLKGEVKNLRGEVNNLRGEVNELSGEFKEIKGMFNRLQASVDGKMYHEKTTKQEITMLSGQIKRHDRWIHSVADKVKMDLSAD